MTKKEFISEIKSKELYQLYEVLNLDILFPTNTTEVRKDKAKLILRHRSCNTEFEISMKGFLHTKHPKEKYHKICPNCKSVLIIEELNQKIEDRLGYNPYEVLSEYRGVEIPIKLRCNSCNAKFEARLYNLLNTKAERGYYCPNCERLELSESKSHTKEEHETSIISKMGYNPYEVLKFKSSREYGTYKCKTCGDTFQTKSSNIIDSLNSETYTYYCPTCNNLKRDTRPYEERLHEIQPTIDTLEPYINRRTKILHKCTICEYEWEVAPSNILSGGNGCPKCGKRLGKSKYETEVKEFLDMYNLKYQTRVTNILSNKRHELDIYISDYHVAIEIDGMYWHNEKYKGKDYHLIKTEECEEKGIRLFHIYDMEWNDKRKRRIIQDKLLYTLGIGSNTKIYARNTWVEVIQDNHVKDTFLEQNHIQGKDKPSIKLGLYCNFEYEGSIVASELVAIMTFCKPRRALGHTSKSLYDYELSRYATQLGYSVVGGFSKLLKYFKDNYDWNMIVTYADRRYSSGTLYEATGFEFSHYSKPSYVYYHKNTKEIHNRYTFRKSELKKLFPEVYDDSLTEFQIMDKLPLWKRVYDCGNLVYVYKRTV